jgi:hypothetical protein
MDAALVCGEQNVRNRGGVRAAHTPAAARLFVQKPFNFVLEYLIDDFNPLSVKS